MENRSVLQWDKDDCAAVGLVKFDLLGLGMLSALHYAVDLIREHRGYELDLAAIPQEDEVYDMLCRADSVGVFQVESRAQMATLPRLRPRTFYDLVVEVALIRPGPIQGGSVHPYIRRRNGQEPVTYLHPLLENSLAKTLGVPLFQEQLMQMAIDVAGFSPADADQLRQAMGSKRSRARMERLRQRVVRGDGRAGDHRGHGRRDLHEDVGLRQLRLPGEPQRVVRLPGVRLVVDQAARAGCVLRRAAQRAADGLLLSAFAGAGRPPPRRRGAHPGPQRVGRGGHPRALPGQPPRPRGAVGDRIGPRPGLGAGRGDRGRPPVRGPGRTGAPGAGSAAPPAGSLGHRGGLRVLRPGAARSVVGGGRGGPVPTGPAGRDGDRRPRPDPAWA